MKYIVLILLAGSLSVFGQSPKALPSYSEPSLSPSGNQIAFVSGGDIWTVASQGGEARLLVAHQSYDSHPMFSPSGEHVAFMSNRTGNGDIYLLEIESGNVRRITFDDAADDLSAWSNDGKYIYFSSSGKDISGMADVYRISIEGGTPMTVTDEGYTNEFFATPSPDGSRIAFNARGTAYRQWWRNGHSHLDESEIWIKNLTKGGTYQQVTKRGAKELWPMWSADGSTIYYMSDRSGSENLWSSTLAGIGKQLTTFKDGRLLWPSIGLDGKTIVFERNFEVWKFDIATQQATPVKITRQGSASTQGIEHLRLNNQFSSLAVSPDGKKAAFIARGEVFAVGTKDGGDAARLTSTASEESDISWSPDSKSIIYVSTRKGTADIYQYTFGTKTEAPLTTGAGEDATPIFSPNGKSIAFVRDGKQLRSLEVATKKELLIAKAFLGTGPAVPSSSITWSPDNQWIAYCSRGTKGFRNVSIVSAAGGEPQLISFLSNTFGGNVIWSPDGKYILLQTRQRTEPGKIARIELAPKAPLYKEKGFDELFTEPAKTTGDVKTQVVFPGIRQRVSFIPLGFDAGEPIISHDGKTLLFVANAGNQQNIYSYSLDETAREPAVAKQITTTANGKSALHFSSDDKEVFYLEQGKIQKVTLETKVAKAVDAIAELDVDFAKEKMVVFQQAWQIQRDRFYDSAMHGADWKKIYGQLEPIAAGTQSSDDLRRVISLMLGELNASHSGIAPPNAPPNLTSGRIGLKFDRSEYEQQGKLKITSVTSLSPVDIEGSIKPGDYLTAVDDTLVNAQMNLDQLLLNKVGKRVKLSVTRAGKAQSAMIQPVNQTTDKRLIYLQWVEQQRAYVSKLSNGRLGYVHIFDMGEQSLDKFYYDLDVENHDREGVVVDIRNNNGGFVNAYALDVLSRKSYLTMTPRGFPAAPARTQLGQRSLEAPTILVTNQHSLSDAEDFTEGYRTMQLGKVVGEPTSGWIIYTGAAILIDGSVMRLPQIKITDNSGKNMELAPRPVDISVTRVLGESEAGKDSQLEAAVSELLKQLKK